MQEIMAKSAVKAQESTPDRKTPPPGTEIMAEKSPPVSLVGRVEERFQKQEDQLEHLKVNLQTRVRGYSVQ